MKNIRGYAENVMSTTPIISEEKPSYTVVGGQKFGVEKGNSLPVTILLLNRGGKPFRSDLFDELQRLGVEEIISVEGEHPAYDVENLTRKYRGLRFILLHQDTTPGEKINIGMEESRGEDVFVLWNDMKLIASNISSRLLQKIVERRELCTLPLIHNEEGEEIPTMMAPVYQGKRLKVIPLSYGQDEKRSIMPFDYCGIYHKEKFQLLGGFDRSLANPYWQKLDFGFRTFLWGEALVANPSLKIWYMVTPQPEDTAVDQSYRKFFLKNLAVRYRRDSAYLPGVALLRYLFSAGGGLVSPFKEFTAIREWVQTHRYRFKQDSKRVIELWDLKGEMKL